MLYVSKTKVSTIKTALSTTIDEYPMNEQTISGAIAHINGRYPEKGFAVNEISTELVYVISGNGKVVTPQRQQTLTQDDVVYLANEERFAWEGNLTLFMVTTPKFDPKQHKVINN